MKLITPLDQADLGNLMNTDVHEAERFWRQDAHNMARNYFDVMATSPQSPGQVAELGPCVIAMCADLASPAVPPLRLLRMQFASRAAFYERLRVLTALGETVAA